MGFSVGPCAPSAPWGMVPSGLSYQLPHFPRCWCFNQDSPLGVVQAVILYKDKARPSRGPNLKKREEVENSVFAKEDRKDGA